MGDYKLVSLNDFGSVLYNLKHDLGETQDIKAQDSLTLAKIQTEYNNWENQMMNPLWREGDQWEEITYHIQKRLMQNKPVLYQSPGEKKQYINNQNSK